MPVCRQKATNVRTVSSADSTRSGRSTWSAPIPALSRTGARISSHTDHAPPGS